MKPQNSVTIPELKLGRECRRGLAFSIHLLRFESKLSLEDAAARIGLSPEELAAAEMPQPVANCEILQKIADFYQVCLSIDLGKVYGDATLL